MTVIRLGRGRFARAARVQSVAEERFAETWGGRFPPFVREYAFHESRRWRFDFAWPDHMVALELEGLGRHQKVEGYREDCVKYSEAAIAGWCVLRRLSCDLFQVHQWVELVERALKDRDYLT